MMVMEVYVAMADGVWLYDPQHHCLDLRHERDIRADTGLRDLVDDAPLTLIYVAHGERMKDLAREERRLRASLDTGFIGQNVYLFCASEGLGTVFRGAVDYRRLARALDLSEGQFVTAVQAVGFPANR